MDHLRSYLSELKDTLQALDLEEVRRVLVLKNGWFSGRFAAMAAGVGA